MTAFVCAGGVNGDVVVPLADHKGSDPMHKTGGREITFSLEFHWDGGQTYSSAPKKWA